MTDHKCNECVRMTVSQDEYISILEQQYEELKEFAEKIVKASADNPDEFFELKKENEKLKEQLTILEKRINTLKIKNASLERKNEEQKTQIEKMENCINCKYKTRVFDSPKREPCNQCSRNEKWEPAE